eukprot:269865-Chlamydomonas_euryale.AAC.1
MRETWHTPGSGPASTSGAAGPIARAGAASTPATSSCPQHAVEVERPAPAVWKADGVDLLSSPSLRRSGGQAAGPSVLYELVREN